MAFTKDVVEKLVTNVTNRCQPNVKGFLIAQPNAQLLSEQVMAHAVFTGTIVNCLVALETATKTTFMDINN